MVTVTDADAHQRGEARLGDERVRNTSSLIADVMRAAPGASWVSPGRAFDMLGGGNTSGSVTLSIRIVIRAASTGASPISVMEIDSRENGDRSAAGCSLRQARSGRQANEGEPSRPGRSAPGAPGDAGRPSNGGSLGQPAVFANESVSPGRRDRLGHLEERLERRARRGQPVVVAEEEPPASGAVR